MLFAFVPSGGIDRPSAGGPPVAAGSAADLYRADDDSGLTPVASVTLYNISTAEAVPGSVPAEVAITPGGHYVCLTWPGQASPGAVIPAAVNQSPGF